MLLRELFEAENSVGIIFGRFNPPHQGHKAAWEEAAKNTHWYVGTNKSTIGPKDPLPFDVKIQAMETIWPNIKGHIIPEQTWWSLAAAVYKKHGEIDLKVITDENDAKVFVPGLQKQNGVEGRHGYYKFSSIEWQPAPRVSSATELRAAVANNDPTAFAKAAGVPADTQVAGEPFFDLVKYYLGQQPKKEGAMKRMAQSSSNKADRTASNNKLQPGLDTYKKKPDSKKKISEGFKLQLERGEDMDVLHIVNTDTGGRTEVRGKKGYESGNYDANDKLHQLLDRVGKSANISELINGEIVSINPKHPDGASAKAATDKAYNESKSADLYHSTHDDESFVSILKSGAIKPNFDHEHTTEKDPRPYISLSRDKKFDMFGSLPITLVIDQTKLGSSHKIVPYDSFASDDDFEKRSSGSSEAEERVYKPIPISYIKYVILRNANWVDSQAVLAAAKTANIPVVDLNGKPITENFADGKKKGKSRPGRVKRAGASCKGSVSSLRAKAKKYSGERGKMYHWCANMKGGKK